MNGNDGTEQQLRELFAADRRADRAAAPGFGDLLRRRQVRRGAIRLAGRPLRLTVLTVAGSLAVATASAWLYLQFPQHESSIDAPRSNVGVLPTGDSGATIEPVRSASGATAGAAVAEEVAEKEPPPTDVAQTEAAPPAAAPAEEDGPDASTMRPALTVPPVAVPPPDKPWAGSGEGKFRGTGGLAVSVVDSRGPIPGATVTISHERGAVKTTSMLADLDGQVEFPVLRASSGYVVQASFPGLASRRITHVSIEKGVRQPLTVTLAEEVVERARVVATTDSLDLVHTGTTQKFTDTFIQDLPASGRFTQHLLIMAPGAQATDADGNRKAHGGRARKQAEEDEVARTELNTEAYDPIRENELLSAVENPLSTFSIDVDTASYSNVRRFIRSGVRPPRDAVRIEEMVNYFSYSDPTPDGAEPFAAGVEVAGCPWNPAHRLVRIGLKGREIERSDLPGSNLVFLVDVSGSMQPPNKLPLLKSALSMLTGQLDGRDRVAIVVYAGSTSLVLPSTSGNAKSTILVAIDRLDAGGGTNGGEGLKQAYRTARRNFIPGGVNRVILATDGDFNLGVTTRAELLRLIEQDAADGIYLTALGFGMDNYKDATLEQLADRGNGNYAYIDTQAEARKVLVEEIGGTLVTIAKDVKIQVEFNPAEVGAYRLVGYENRTLRKEDFNDDRKDAGEIGSGHSVTALYEIVLPGAESSTPPVDPLRYQTPAAISEKAAAGELLTLKIRYKQPGGRESRFLEYPVVDHGLPLDQATTDFKFAAAVAGFGMLLRDSSFAAELTLHDVRALALEGLGADPGGHRSGFVALLDSAASLE